MVSMIEPESPQMMAVHYISHSFVWFSLGLFVFPHVDSPEEGGGDKKSASHTAGTSQEATESPGGE